MARRLTPLLLLLALLLPLGFLPDRAQAGDEALEPLGRVRVRGDRFVRVGPDALGPRGRLAAGESFLVRRGGRAVPLAAGGGENALCFLALGTARRAGATATYSVFRGKAPGARAPAAAGAVPGLEALPVFRTDDADTMFGDLAAARPEVYAAADLPTWFRYFIPPGRSIATPFPPLGSDTRHREITAHVYATRIGEVALEARWSGTSLGVARVPTAAGGASVSWTVPAGFLPAPDAKLELRDVSPPAPPPPPQDVSSGRGTLWIDTLRVLGERVPRAEDEVLHYRVAGRRQVAIARAAPTDAVLVALTDTDGGPLPPPTPREARAPDGTPVFVVDVGPSAATLHLARAAADAALVPAGAPADPLAAAGRARHVILATPPLVEPARRLAAHRSATGLASAVVPVADVYDRYGHGEAGPGPIRAFLLDLMAREGAPLEYVVLAGDAAVDRVDLLDEVTIPAPMARTMYNGATAADRLYALPRDGSSVGGPSIGRLPFRTTEAMQDFVDRLIRYESAPPADPTRRLMRFVTSEGRFGAFIDRVLEQMFRTVVSTDIPPAYDVEVTFASLASPYLWPPPEFNDKVIQGFDEGCLFYTYVGHGFAHGFDSLRAGNRQFPILTKDDVGRIRGRGTLPVAFVLACTTAMFDMPYDTSIGEALLAEAGGPIAYWGATRICHPAANTLLGRAIARTMATGQGRLRLGPILDRARDQVLTKEGDPGRALIDFAIRQLAAGADPDRLALEGSWMYALLGDPATAVAFPRNDVRVEASWRTTASDPEPKPRVLEVSLEAPVPDGTTLHVSLEVPRNRSVAAPERVGNPLDPNAFPRIRANHQRMNDLRLVHRDVVVQGGRAAADLALPDGVESDALVVKAWCIGPADVHQGGLRVPAP